VLQAYSCITKEGIESVFKGGNGRWEQEMKKALVGCGA